MSEEQTITEPTEQPIDQQAMQDDAWSEDNIAYDDPSDFEDPEGDYEEEVVDETQTAKPEEQKAPGEKPPEENNDSTPEPLKERPKGYLGLLHEKGEDGTYSIDHNKALKSLLGDPEKLHQYRGPVYEKEENVAVEPEDTIETRIQNHVTAKQELQGTVNVWRDAFVKAVNEGYDNQKAFQIAENHVQNLMSSEFQKMDLKHQTDMAKFMQGDVKSESEKQQILKDAQHNESLIAAELGGDENYKEFFYGEGQKAIVDLFHLAHPDYLKGKTQKQYSEGLQNWWNSIRSNMQSFRKVQQFVGTSLLANNIDVFRNNAIKQASQTKQPSHKPSKGYSVSKQSKGGGNADAQAASRYFGSRYTV